MQKLNENHAATMGSSSLNNYGIGTVGGQESNSINDQAPPISENTVVFNKQSTMMTSSLPLLNQKSGFDTNASED